MSMEIPSWWHVTTQIWVVLLNGCDPREILLWPIRSTAHIWLVTRHQYRISPLIPQSSFCGKTSGGFAKCRLFSHFTTKLPVTAQWSKGALQERLHGALKLFNFQTIHKITAFQCITLFSYISLLWLWNFATWKKKTYCSVIQGCAPRKVAWSSEVVQFSNDTQNLRFPWCHIGERKLPVSTKCC